MDDTAFIARQEFETVLLRAQLELLQRVNKLVGLLEAQYGECKARESNESTSMVATSQGLETSVLEDRTQGTETGHSGAHQ